MIVVVAVIVVLSLQNSNSKDALILCVNKVQASLVEANDDVYQVV